MQKTKNIIFVAEKKHLNASINSGVQICTQEFIKLFEINGYNIVIFPIEHTRNIITRIKIKLGIELYSLYNFKKYFKLLKKVATTNIPDTIVLNQVDLMGFAPLIKQNLNCKVAILSHGNESGDFLPSIVRKDFPNFIIKIRDIYRLGKAIYKESYSFINYIDLILSISETEREINNWLGTPKSIFIPRTFTASFLDWNPAQNTIGFIGTLNHFPNIKGLTMLLDALKKSIPNNVKVKVIGGPELDGIKLANDYPFVDYLGYLPEENVVEEVKTWSIIINPVFWYSRGASTKLAQAINWGIPIVSTPAGNRGYVWKNGSIPTAETPDQMTILIKELLASNENLRKTALSIKDVCNSGPSLIDLGSLLEKYVS